MRKLAAGFFLPILAVAQLTPNSITVTATRNATAQPDVARFYLSVDAPADASLQDVVAVAAGAGITGANFSGVSYYQSPVRQPVTWTFSTTAPIADLKAKIGALTALQNSLAKEKKFSLSFSFDASEVSPQSQSCTLPDLIADARAQAAKLASAAGMSVGAVQAMSGSVTGTAAAPSGIGSVTPAVRPACSITVKFALGGF